MGEVSKWAVLKINLKNSAFFLSFDLIIKASIA